MKCEKCSKCESCEKSTHRTEEEKKTLTKRLNIIEGQIRGIKQMIEDIKIDGMMCTHFGFKWNVWI